MVTGSPRSYLRLWVPFRFKNLFPIGTTIYTEMETLRQSLPIFPPIPGASVRNFDRAFVCLVQENMLGKIEQKD